MNTTGTHNMCTLFALACWRVGHALTLDGFHVEGSTITDRRVVDGHA